MKICAHRTVPLNYEPDIVWGYSLATDVFFEGMSGRFVTDLREATYQILEEK